MIITDFLVAHRAFLKKHFKMRNHACGKISLKSKMLRMRKPLDGYPSRFGM
jgi:hypothetical protein